MKKLPQFSVNYPITVMMLVLGVLLLGYISFEKLSVDLLPEMDAPRLFVEIQVGEKPPEEIEKQFVENIEALSSRLKNVVNVSSISKVGLAQITVEYTWEADMDEAFLELQKALTGFSQNAELDELTISQYDPNAEPVMLIGLSHPNITDLDELRRTAENNMLNELVRIEGIASVELLGGQEREVVVETNHSLMEAFGLSSQEVANKILSFNRNISSGSIVEMGRKYIIKGVGEFRSLDDIQNVIVAYKTQSGVAAGEQGGSNERVPIYLQEIADVFFQNKDPENIVHVNRTRCMALAVYKETRFNTIKAVERLLDELQNLRDALPGYQLTVLKNQAEFIRTAVSEVEQTALIGILLAVIVIFVFLRRIGVTAIISVAIPVSVVATFNLMYFNGLTLNIMTLGGLALGAGMLVDNAIVVMENIYRRLESGASLKEAAVEGTSQVGGAITASTLTTIIVFLPIVYLHGTAGELFKDQAWTVAFSLLSSLFVAILVIPMLSVRFLKAPSIDLTRTHSIKFGWYYKSLQRILQRKGVILIITFIAMGIAVMLLPRVGSEFMPKADQGEFTIKIQLPEGTNLLRTESVVSNIESTIMDLIGEDVETLYSKIGPSVDISGDKDVTFEGENTAVMSVILKQKRSASSAALIDRIAPELQQIPDTEMQFIQEQTALQATIGTESSPLVIEVKGEELDVLYDLTTKIQQQLTQIDALNNIETSFDEGRPEINVVIDRTIAGIWNIGIDNLASQLQDELTGRDAGQWDHEGELKDITIRFPKIAVNELKDMVIKTNSGASLPLDQIAKIELTQAPKEILRRNQVRIGTLSAHITGDQPFDHIIKRVEAQLKSISFPPKYSYEITGEEQKRREAFDNLKFALLLAVVLVYMVLASQFESLLHPFIIIFTVPLATIGSILLFYSLGIPFNIMAYIGMIMLAGIAVNDSIIFVDAINQLRRAGIPRIEAILEAGQMRIRPIIMTSLTTILALLPLTIGIGEGAALRRPMALAVIGGLVSSTLLTLVVIPVVYALVDRRKTL
ncbi:efflux RND transporter permease subunit [candidate division KSB1 bacterium]|nr:efflux RND transporter permease subunit [candidate division KSB1 bacterium]